MATLDQSTSNLSRYLNGIEFPTNRNRIVEYAKAHGAEAASLAVLDALPDERYSSMADVFSGVTEERQRVQVVEPPPFLEHPAISPDVDVAAHWLSGDVALTLLRPLLLPWLIGQEAVFALLLAHGTIGLNRWQHLLQPSLHRRLLRGWTGRR